MRTRFRSCRVDSELKKLRLRETENRSRVARENVKPSSHQGRPPQGRQRLKQSETFFSVFFFPRFTRFIVLSQF